jgi:cysteinyl-tRNA synthetase
LEKNQEVFSLIENYTVEFRDSFSEAMDDDFNSARALGYLFDYLKKINGILNNTELIIPEDAASIVKEQFKLVGEVLGLFGHLPEDWFKLRTNASKFGEENLELNLEEIEKLIKLRDQARNNKNFKLADEIRNKLGDSGILVEDSSHGTIWKIMK